MSCKFSLYSRYIYHACQQSLVIQLFPHGQTRLSRINFSLAKSSKYMSRRVCGLEVQESHSVALLLHFKLALQFNTTEKKTSGKSFTELQKNDHHHGDQLMKLILGGSDKAS